MATYSGSGKKISAKQKKAAIMAANDWTEEQYRKQYDIFKNKLRAYESFRRAHGAKVETQSPQDVLYRAAKAKRREGEDYKPSIEMQRIQSFSAVSITKGRKLAQDFESGYSRRRAATFGSGTIAAFKGFIEAIPKAQEIVYGVPLTEDASSDLIEKLTQGEEYEVVDGKIYVNGEPVYITPPITDPVKREEALKALADFIHAKQSPSGETFADGETFGSDEAGMDFDYSGFVE